MSADQTYPTQRIHLRTFVRLQHIHEIIRSGGCPSIHELAERVERHPRTIKRDIKVMREDLNAPLVYDRYRKGFRYTAPGWQLPPVPFSEGEILAFFTAHQVLQALGQKPEAVLLQGALAKLAALLPDRVTVNPSMLSAALTFQPMPYVMVEPHLLRRLTRAATDQRTLFMHYYSQHRNERTKRRIDVLHLHNFAGDWYMIAFDHLRQEIRDFHVGRIQHLEETDNFFVPPPDWHADTHLRRGFFMVRGGRLTTASLVFDAYQARWIRERHSFHVDEQRQDLPDGGLRLWFPVGHNGLEAVARFCLTYAGHCRVEKPPALRKLVQDRLQQGLAQHGEK